jgi:hypothetical protein
MLEYVLEVNELTAAPDDYRAQVVNVTSHRPSELIAVIPNLAPDGYRLKIVTQYSGSYQLKHPHTATFDKPLTVQ